MAEAGKGGVVVLCGITGWVAFDEGKRPKRRDVLAMTETLQHRGPDAAEIWASPEAVFGHTRLIVIDADGGRQPMTRSWREKTYTLVYNGELYNTDELRERLKELGWVFQSYSDTEVVLAAAAVWQEEAPAYMNGIFAFALWTHETKQLLLGRDRFGVKPLFYQEVDNGLIFASEIKALLAHQDAKAVLDETGVHELMALSPMRTPGSGVFKNVKEVLPAHTLNVAKEGMKSRRYWQFSSQEHLKSREETIENVRAHLFRIVNQQLVSDEPIGTFLSGGVDSSALTAIAATKLDQLPTFSVDYEANDKHFTSSKFQPASDQDFIPLVSNQYKTVHQTFTMPIQALSSHLKEAMIARDLPGMADIDGSLLWMAGEVKPHVTAALSGECADEIFGGYPWFYKPELMERENFPWMSSHTLRQQLLHPSYEKHADLAQFAKERFEKTKAETPLVSGESEAASRRRQLFYVNAHWFMATLLERKDRMTMKRSLEVRVPFADHELAEYVWNIPWSLKFEGNVEKAVLRHALKGVLPEQVLWRKKSPYPKTHHPDYTKAVQALVTNILHDKDAPIHELIHRNTLQTIVSKAAANTTEPFFGQLMAGPQLLAYMYQLNEWMKAYDVKLA
ncbi:asparagine synthase (glutamine-hydrolyzing) [Salsuginibacillus halophilus]|uniref:asparagine synthase (glutamine-hydrolyzing) n=1 Tax=Salsuginibacillus halophilus TaxID=517424 RepID=UPI0031F45423